MLVEFTCSHCGATLEADGSMGGGRADCPGCGAVLMVPAPSIRPGTTIAGFYIERKLGSGGMGEVYLATQVSIGRKVAVKLLPPAMVRDGEQLERFLHEARLAGSLEHPNIVAVHDAGEDSGVHFIAMSYVEGVSLGQLLKAHPVPEHDALHLAKGIAGALAYAWNKHGLLHRDIKPGNIMVDSEGEPKLLDLGLAKRVEGDVDLTSAGLIVGTPAYMSPEQADPRLDVDFRTDMYSLGATLYHAVTGSKPYTGKTVAHVLRLAARGNVPDANERNPDVSAECAALIRRLMATKPDKRFSRWEDGIAAFDQLLAAPSGVAAPAARPSVAVRDQPPTPVTQAAPTAGKRRLARPLARVLFVALLIGVFVGGLFLRSLFEAPDASPDEDGAVQTPTEPLTDAVADAPGPTPSAAEDVPDAPSVEPSAEPTDTAKPEGTASDTPAPAPAPQEPKPAPKALLDRLEKLVDMERRLFVASVERRREACKELGLVWPVRKPLLTPEQVRNEIEKQLADVVAAEFSPAREAALRAKADDLFRVYKKGEEVEVVLRGGRGFLPRVKGIYCGMRGPVILIGSRKIVQGDLDPADLVHFSPKLAERKKKFHLARELAAQEEQKVAFGTQKRPEVTDRVYREAGYVPREERWEAASDLLEAAMGRAAAGEVEAMRRRVYAKYRVVRRNGGWVYAPKEETATD